MRVIFYFVILFILVGCGRNVKDFNVAAYRASCYYVATDLISQSGCEFGNEALNAVFVPDSDWYVKGYVDTINTFGEKVRVEFMSNLRYLEGNPKDSNNWEVRLIYFR